MKRMNIVSRHSITYALAGILFLAGCGQSAPVDTTPEAPATESVTQPTEAAQPTVSYLGPEGTYTQEACTLFFNGEGTYLPQADVSASVQAVVDGASTYAVIPQENTIGGPVAEYLDEVISHEGLSVVGEVELPINQNLLAKPGTQLADIKRVYSHKQGLAQGKAWLAENLPNAELVEVSSTAEGARMAAEEQDEPCAAIGAAAAADVYGLEVLAPGIQMSDTNKTRFYVLSLEEPAREASDRMAFVATGAAEGLPKLLTAIDEQGLTIVALHDRPLKTELGHYAFLIECTGGGYEQFAALEGSDAFSLRYLGSFPVQQPQAEAQEAEAEQQLDQAA